MAAAGGGFVAVRPLHSGQGGVVFASADGSSWRYVTTLASASGLKITAVNGGTGGYSVLGQVPRGAMYGFTSTDGTHWKKAASFGQAPGTTTGAAITADGVLIATGATSTPSQGGRGERPYLAVAGPGHDPRVVSVTGLAGASDHPDRRDRGRGRRPAAGRGGGAGRHAGRLVGAQPSPARTPRLPGPPPPVSRPPSTAPSG